MIAGVPRAKLVCRNFTASVFQCPHSMKCPRIAESSNTRTVCHFPVSFTPLPFMTLRSAPRTTGRFSYVVLEKNGESREDDTWPRVVENVIRGHHHAICRLCCADGKLKELIGTKRKHKDTIYPMLRKIRWGDRLPVQFSVEAREVDHPEVSMDEEDQANFESEIADDDKKSTE